MTPGIQPSNVKIRLRKKLAMRPVISTASGGKTTQKKYRSAFISFFCWLSWSSFVSPVAVPVSTIRNLRSPDSTANRGRAGAAAIQARRFALQSRSPCTCRFARSALPAFPSGASHHGLHFLADRALLPLASQSLLPSRFHDICRRRLGQAQPRPLLF